MTVSTRLRRAARPATWPAAPGTGVRASISTTDSTSAAGSAIRSPASLTMRRSSATAALPPRRGIAGQGGEQRLAVVAVNAVLLALGLGAEADDPSSRR